MNIGGSENKDRAVTLADVVHPGLDSEVRKKYPHLYPAKTPQKRMELIGSGYKWPCKEQETVVK